MTNGDGGVPRIPGFFVGGGVALSNVALLIGGATALAWLWFTMSHKRMESIGLLPEMDDESLGKQVEGDIYAYAASPQSVRENRDRIHQAINRIRDTFTAAREAYIKKIRDLHIALRKKLITHEQFRTQVLAAHTEFRAAIKARHREIMQELNIPHFASNDTAVVPTLG